MAEARHHRGLKIILGGLLLLAAAAAAHTSLLSQTPAAIEPQLEQLSLQGERLERLASSQPNRERHYATSTLHRWNVQATKSNQHSFKLEALTLHNRTSSGLGLDTMLNHAGLPAAVHHLQTLEAENPQARDEVAIGRIGSELVLRTCLTPKGRASVSDLKEILHAERPTGAKAKLIQAMGLQDNIRWECLLVSITAPESTSTEQELITAWRDLKAPLLATIHSAER